MDIPATLTGATHRAEGRKVIVASSVGAVIEYYDFFLYGSLATIIAKQFFSALDPSAAFIFALLAFAAGFLVRPLGALVFGRIGDLVGRARGPAAGAPRSARSVPSPRSPSSRAAGRRRRSTGP